MKRGMNSDANSLSSLLEIGLVVPLYNEADGIGVFHHRLSTVLNCMPYRARIWYVDDGSEDETAAMVNDLSQADHRVTLLQLSRNFGHQIALTAGLDHADGDVIITMDGDGQHPPELIPLLLERYEQGYDVVLTRRTDTSGQSWFKRMTSSAFYSLINRLSETEILPGSADFRLMTREVVLGLRQIREYHRFIRGLVIWMGYRRAVVYYEADQRIAGRSKYSFHKMLALASNAVFSFSTLPLKLAILLGFSLVLIAVAEALYTLYFFISGQRERLVPGWASLMFALLGIGGVQLIILGVIGQYIGLIFQEVKRRPLYFLRHQNVTHTHTTAEELHERIAGAETVLHNDRG